MKIVGRHGRDHRGRQEVTRAASDEGSYRRGIFFFFQTESQRYFVTYGHRRGSQFLYCCTCENTSHHRAAKNEGVQGIWTTHPNTCSTTRSTPFRKYLQIYRAYHRAGVEVPPLQGGRWFGLDLNPPPGVAPPQRRANLGNLQRDATICCER